MPRAFLITNRRYNSTVEYESRESSPERKVWTAECWDDISPPLRAAFPREDTTSLPTTGTISPSTTHTLSPAAGTLSPDSGTCTPDSGTRSPVLGRSTPDTGSRSPASILDGFYQLSSLEQLAEISLATASLSDRPTPSPPTWTDDPHVCPECGKRYSTSSNLARHRQTHRSVSDKKARKCPHCDKVYVSMPAFSMHVRTHAQGCQCPYCGKCFSRPWLLQGHIRTHTGEKPFKCPVCNKAFADKSNLRAHIQTHSDTKPFVCQRCGKAFALKSYLYKHEESSCVRFQRQDKHGV